MGKTYFWQKTALPNTLYCWQKFKQPTLKLSFFLLGVFYYLPNVNDFIVEVLIGSINSQVYIYHLGVDTNSPPKNKLIV